MLPGSDYKTIDIDLRGTGTYLAPGDFHSEVAVVNIQQYWLCVTILT